MIPFIGNSRKDKLMHSDKEQTSGCLGVGVRERHRGEQERKAEGNKITFWGDR